MTLEEMKVIAELRNKGDMLDNFKFLAVVHQKWDKLIAVVEAAKAVTNYDGPGDIGSAPFGILDKALEELEKE